jgi:hypothetical protein
MLGPGVAWYIAVAAFLFGIGALGVLIRATRSSCCSRSS